MGARVSVAAACEIWRLLGENGNVPSAFQGRIGNSKALWVVSHDSVMDSEDPIRIELGESQRKFHRLKEDYGEQSADRLGMTLDVLDWSNHPTFWQLSISLLAILWDRGVPR